MGALSCVTSCVKVLKFHFQIFEKALDEPKYSSMYAQLCKRLAENAPNFDPADKPCTFKRLLLNRCKDEFENRLIFYFKYQNCKL